MQSNKSDSEIIPIKKKKVYKYKKFKPQKFKKQH
jgi:hypothetical protein